jgi:hypothetical protein
MFARSITLALTTAATLSTLSCMIAAVPQKALASGAYGADTCRQGYVWREAFDGDHVCVTPGTRAQAARDNRLSRFRVAPGAAPYCRQGYVWRDAYNGDAVCVTPETRAQAHYDNQQAPYRYQP